MELLKEYLDKVIHVHDGIYHAKFGGETTLEEIDELCKCWKKQFGEDPKHIIIISHDDIEISYLERFDFHTAMKLVQQGRKVTRNNESNFILYMEEEDGNVKEQILPPSQYQPTNYIIDNEDLQATDWMMIGD